MKPENRFIARVHRQLPDVYHEKMCNPYRGGTPDVWYSGARGDLWVEYKWLPKLPVSPDGRVTLALTPLQKIWLRDRWFETREVAVILGTPHGGVWFEDRTWEHSHGAGWLRTLMESPAFLAARISQITGAKHVEAVPA